MKVLLVLEILQVIWINYNESHKIFLLRITVDPALLNKFGLNINILQFFWMYVIALF